MNNKKARQSAIDVYCDVYLDAPINSPKFKWAFDRLRNAECGFKRSQFYMRHYEFDLVSLTAEEIESLLKRTRGE